MSIYRPFQRLIIATLAAVFTLAVPVKADPIAVTAGAIPYFHIGSSSHAAGKLTFVGGVELESSNDDFGGLSGLRITADGKRLFAVSDNAHWLTAEITRNEHGAITGLNNADYSCICRRNGQPYNSKHWGDAEAVEISGNRAYIAFERLNRINGYDLTANHRLGPPAQVTPSFKSRSIDYSDGFESLALVPDDLPHGGKYVVITENSLNSAGANRAFIADANSIEEFAVSRSDDYSATDATFTPDGDLLILERRYGLSIGVNIRIRLIDWSKVMPGKTVQGEILVEAGLSSRIDNMEGISAWHDDQGRTRIAILSDDNYTRLQRTLLLEFVMAE